MSCAKRSAVTLLLTAATLSTAVLAGEPGAPQWRVKRLHYHNSDGENGVTTHVYDAEGSCIRSIWELLDGTRWSTNTYAYDDAGRVVGKHREFSEGRTSDQTYDYDASGRLIHETFSRSDGVAGEVRYERSADGRTETATCDRMNGWLTGVIRYTLDARGRRTAGVVERDGKTLGAIALRYDERGLLVEEHWTLGGWSQTFRTEYEPASCTAPTTSNPFAPASCEWRVAGEHYTFDGRLGGPSEYTYGPSGRLEQKVFTRSDGVRTVTTYRYGGDDILTSSARTFADGRRTTFEYRFDEHRRLVSRRWTGEDGRPGLEAYEYGVDGRLSGARYEGMDGWLTGTLTFSHDRYGRLDSGTFTAADGPGAVIRFACNEHGLPEEIRWDFDDGHTQVYRFSYEAVR